MTSTPGDGIDPFDVGRIRSEFPILGVSIRGGRLAYLDNAATTQKPRPVIDAVARSYRESNANVHRGVHELSERATAAYEGARETVGRHLNARSPREVVFVRGTTEAINLVAASWGRAHLHAGDEVLLTEMEHHSNIVPWQLLRDQLGIRLRVVPVDERGEIDVGEAERLVGSRTRLLSLCHVSNALGTVNPVQEIVRSARRNGVPVLVDGAQAIPHGCVDVQALGCDFYAFSGHKAYGPTGIGVLWAREELLAEMPPYQGGGEMIRSVSFESTEFADSPQRFEAGTPHVAGAVGLAAALDYLGEVGLERVAAHEARLLQHAIEGLGTVPGVRLIGTARQRAGAISFVLDGVHAHDLAAVLDEQGIAIRSGHHCAMPVMRRFGVAATARASVALYNTLEEIDRLVAAVASAGDTLRA